MFEDKMEAIIKEEVSKAVSGLMTQEGMEKLVSETISAVFEPMGRIIARTQIAASQTYISEKEVGDIFPISPATLKSWRSRKLPGPPYYRIGDRIVYKLSELYEFFERHKILDESQAAC